MGVEGALLPARRSPLRRRGRALAPLLLAALPTLASAQGVDLAASPRGVIVSEVAPPADPTQTYELYLPTGFDPARRWPLLMVFDPRARGRLAAEIFLPAAERHGWIVASSNRTMSDQVRDDPNARAVNAMFPDLMRRLPVDPARIYATGFSGGAMLAWIVGLRSGQLAGVISVGGRPPDGFESSLPGFAVWAAAGTTDFNYLPTLELDDLAARGGVTHRFEPFPGPHAWFDAAEAERAVAWLEILAMRDGLRARDAAWIDAAYAADLAGAEALAAAGDALAAWRRFGAITASYRGLRDVGGAERGAAALAASPARQAGLKEEKWVTRYEEQGRRRIAEGLALLAVPGAPPSPARLRATVGVDALVAQAAGDGPRALAARRVIASVKAQFGFYRQRELFAAGDFTTAVAALGVSLAADPENPVAWYNLACAYARLGQKRDALAALGRALDEGLPRPEQMATDEDLAALRGEPGFERLLERARAAPPPD